MRKLSLAELLKNGLAFTVISSLAIDAGLLLTQRIGMLNFSSDWYFNAPLVVWVVIGIPVTIGLAERLLYQINVKPGPIVSIAAGGPAPTARKIKWNINGREKTLLAQVMPFIFENPLSSQKPIETRTVAWIVPIYGNRVIIREKELRAFLEISANRSKYQFSRRYWTETRRPPLDRPKYEAFMRLLTEAGLIEGRHAHGRASGRLITHPRHAITFLKHESRFCIK
jgi:hypothetical protein